MARTETRSNIALRCVICCSALLLCLLGWSSPLFGDWRDDVGFSKLVSVLGTAAPNGAGVPISLVEAENGSSRYFPNTASEEFGSASDPLGIAVAFIDGSGGQSEGVSSHANGQANNFFGNTTSAAPAANQVTVYEANEYMDNVLNLKDSDRVLPDPQNFRVQNFSWIGSFATDINNPTTTELNTDREALRRFDFAINADNITALVGLNNIESPLPHLLGHSYNSIAVGRSDGTHSSGLTHLADYGIGRSKPDLVVPQTSSSAATSSASSSVTYLHSSDTVLGTDAAKSETMKALLLAGATKNEFAEWSQIDSGGQWHPLDDTYGAGELNLYNSYLVTLGGQAAGRTTMPTHAASHGWDYQVIQPGTGNKLLYDFVIPHGSVAEELSIVLAWNAFIEAPFDSSDPVLADLQLELVDNNGITIDLNLDDGALLDGLSNSLVDNVEHLYLTDLSSGTYTLKVSSNDLASDFGLAWRTSTLLETPTADFDEDGDTDGVDFFAWQRGFGTLINATHADGDADGDGDVDTDDLGIYRSELAIGAPSLSSSLLAVPEPASWFLVGAGLLLTLALRSYHSRTGINL